MTVYEAIKPSIAYGDDDYYLDYAFVFKIAQQMGISVGNINQCALLNNLHACHINKLKEVEINKGIKIPFSIEQFKGENTYIFTSVRTN